LLFKKWDRIFGKVYVNLSQLSVADSNTNNDTIQNASCKAFLKKHGKNQQIILFCKVKVTLLLQGRWQVSRVLQLLL